MFVVTRQDYSLLGVKELVVEIARGGRDYANPGAFCAEYPGEFEEFESLREAVEIAISIAELWKRDTDEFIMIAIGNTGGSSVAFETDLADDDAYKELRRRAEKFDAGPEKRLTMKTWKSNAVVAKRDSIEVWQLAVDSFLQKKFGICIEDTLLCEYEIAKEYLNDKYTPEAACDEIGEKMELKC